MKFSTVRKKSFDAAKFLKNKRGATRFALSFALFLICCASVFARKAPPPNIVLILADDLGYADLGVYGAPQNKTPNLDRLAAEGARLTDFYVTAPNCTPSRAALLTGRYQTRSGLTNVIFPNSAVGLKTGEITIADRLKKLGYATMAIGKWHLGDRPEFLPTAHGFDSYFGIPYSNDMDSAFRKEPPIPLMRDAKIIEQPANQDTITSRYTDEALKFIRANKNQPFFLYLAHTMPHFPLHVSPQFRGHSGNNLYGDVIEELDASTGEIISLLKELNLEKNTIVIFTSDNGPWLEKLPDAGSALPLRAGKQTVYEGGVREPFIIRYPNVIPPNQTIKQPVISLDLFPTLLKWAGATISNERVLDGADIANYLTGKIRKIKNRTFYFVHDGDLRAIRSGKWKLHVAGFFKNKQHEAELYNLQTDAGEINNLAAARPETVKKLAEQARRADSELRNPIGKIENSVGKTLE